MRETGGGLLVLQKNAWRWYILSVFCASCKECTLRQEAFNGDRSRNVAARGKPERSTHSAAQTAPKARIPTLLSPRLDIFIVT